MSFAENINRICREQGTTLTALVKRLGLSTSKVSYWNGGSLPKEDVMIMLAKALSCSVMDFFADESDLEQNSVVDSLDEDEQEMVRIFRTYNRRKRHEFMAMVYNFDKQVELAGDTGENQADIG